MGQTMSQGLSQSFFIPTPPLTEKNLPDQTGKVFIVTGGYAGVGAQLSKILYSRNATVYVAGRSADKANKTINDIKTAVPNSSGKLIFLDVDLCDLTTIKPAVDRFLSQESKLHWLNNNAGVMIPPKDAKGKQGMDLQYQTNILGPFLFTKLLLPVLKRTAQSEEVPGSVRVSWAGSLAVILQSPKGGVEWDGDGMLKYALHDPYTGYGVTKAANYLLGAEFGRRYAADGVLHNSYNPGNLSTELQRHVETAWSAIAIKLLNLLIYEPVYGAYTELYCGLSQDLTLENDQGSYFVPWGRKSSVRGDIEAERGEGKKADRLWDWCDGITKEYAL